jgi:hypothetical protein
MIMHRARQASVNPGKARAGISGSACGRYLHGPVENFFLGCFAFGLIFTVASFLLGAFGTSHHWHIFDFHIDIGGHHGGHDAGADGHHGPGVSPFNVSTISAFLAWFGGAGWLLTRYSDIAALGVIGGATLSGIVGGGIVFLALAKWIMPGLSESRPEDFRPEGVIARVTSVIAAGGTGEIVYVQGGSRHAEGARHVAGEALEQGTEVVIMRRERGIAYVERWERLTGQGALPASGEDQS